MSEEDDENFKKAEICWMCEQPFLIKSQYISPYIKEKIDQNKVKSIPDWVTI